MTGFQSFVSTGTSAIGLIATVLTRPSALDGRRGVGAFTADVRAAQLQPSQAPILARRWADRLASPTDGVVTGPGGAFVGDIFAGDRGHRTWLTGAAERCVAAVHAVEHVQRGESEDNFATLVEGPDGAAVEILASEGAVRDGATLAAGGDLVVLGGVASNRQLWTAVGGTWCVTPGARVRRELLRAVQAGPAALVRSMFLTLADLPPEAINDAELGLVYAELVAPVVRPTRAVTSARAYRPAHAAPFMRTKPAVALDPRLWGLMQSLDRVATWVQGGERGVEAADQVRAATGGAVQARDAEALWAALVQVGPAFRDRRAASCGWGWRYLDQVLAVAARGVEAFDQWLHEGDLSDRALRALRTQRGRGGTGRREGFDRVSLQVLTDWATGRFS